MPSAHLPLAARLARLISRRTHCHVNTAFRWFGQSEAVDWSRRHFTRSIPCRDDYQLAPVVRGHAASPSAGVRRKQGSKHRCKIASGPSWTPLPASSPISCLQVPARLLEESPTRQRHTLDFLRQSTEFFGTPRVSLWALAGAGWLAGSCCDAVVICKPRNVSGDAVMHMSTLCPVERDKTRMCTKSDVISAREQLGARTKGKPRDGGLKGNHR